MGNHGRGTRKAKRKTPTVPELIALAGITIGALHTLVQLITELF